MTSLNNHFVRAASVLMLASAGLVSAQTQPPVAGNPGAPGARPAMMEGHHGMHGGMHGGMGGGMRERGMEHMLWAVDATPEQRSKLKALREKMHSDAKPLHEQLAAGRKRGMELLAAPSIDRAAIEKLRQDQSQIHEKLSKLRTENMTASAEVFTPAQRAKLAERMKQRMQHGQHRSEHRGEHRGMPPGAPGAAR